MPNINAELEEVAHVGPEKSQSIENTRKIKRNEKKK
jgi:hypothetical protein